MKNFKQYLVPEQKKPEKKPMSLLEQAWLNAKEKVEREKYTNLEPFIEPPKFLTEETKTELEPEPIIEQVEQPKVDLISEVVNTGSDSVLLKLNKGEKGDRGDKGEKGDTGPQGERGVPGIMGLRGDVGPQGPVGPQGKKGVKGDIGPQGKTGARGEKGD